ncbi:hypothetical protein [Streptomyces melanogenes]|uniref:hypothetical protein n=1 Tax=Streptomyces melanogenes TaxID=67326 RepID=UPI00167D9641|nr:hypothetical protein [Streptomyces melanogenes]GGP71959.1 hypothetical protein GCM10010278_57440 [Streptomyces melanogenes]
MAFGYVPQAGYVRLQWNPEGGIRATRVFTGQTMDLCARCDFPIPHEAEPEHLFMALATCNKHSLFGAPSAWDRYDALWGDESMHRRARHGHGLGITSDDLLRVLETAAKWGRIRVEVEHLQGPQVWQARMWVRHPDEDQEAELGPVVVDAGDVRTMLRAADYLMPKDSYAAGELIDLMQLDADRITQFIDEELHPAQADAILCLAIFGGDLYGPPF